MKLLEKLEDLLNRALLWVGALFMRGWRKVCPTWLMRLHDKWTGALGRAKEWPTQAKAYLQAAPTKLKTVDYKGVFAQAIEAAKKNFEKHRDQSPFRALFSAIVGPFKYLWDWVATLSPLQSLLLAGFTVASVFAVVGIAFNSHAIFQKQAAAGRAPASIPVDEYNRPEYYKLQTRTISIDNLQIPVYVQDVTQLRALSIDFSITTSNRGTKMWMAGHEFHIRDQLAMHLEPVIPSFPLTDEGRVMLSDKIKLELNIFLAENHVEGQVTDVRIIHVLAH